MKNILLLHVNQTLKNMLLVLIEVSIFTFYYEKEKYFYLSNELM